MPPRSSSQLAQSVVYSSVFLIATVVKPHLFILKQHCITHTTIFQRIIHVTPITRH